MGFCTGQNVSSGEPITIDFGQVIDHVDPILGSEDTWIAPGFIDLQVNGFAGADYNDPRTPLDAIEVSLSAAFSTGVTRLFPTVITGSFESIAGAFRNLANARATLATGHAIEAFHLEGPYISPDDGPRGAHSREWVRQPNLDEFARFQEAAAGHIRLITVSPEWPGAAAFIEALVSQGVVVSIGHTSATEQQIADAVSAGASLSTHLGNGAHKTLPRHPNYLWQQLADDRLAASFIVDGIHLSDSFLRVALRAKGAERTVLVTDAIAAAMCPPGDYMLGDVAVTLRGDGRVVMRGGERLAGSSLRMDRAVERLLTHGWSMPAAFAAATINPARIGRVPGRLRGIAPGSRADLIRFRMDGHRLEILETYLSGELVYRNHSA